MRHGDKINNLGRKTAHRHALLMNLACALIENKRIFTTLAKAKALRTYVEPLITKSKDDSTHSRRMVFAYLKNKEAVSSLFKDVAGKVAERNGGYTRIIKTGNRQGDAAEMAMIELVDFNEIYTNGKAGADTTAKKTTRRSRAKGTAKKATEKAPKTDSSAENKSADDKSAE
ncbi:MAG: 50S ribosomal protein L17 [Bacteroidetes bacterium]|nr:50S ribosomal protein L17 [Bacteroidota bacterium]